ncbi:MAG TPA: hypothetical protein VD866_04835 [Urbifossiella sp.]|nr:hypothetical protein [Urbifossiella sp.]
MEYRVTCGCGAAVPVRAGDAGSVRRCACGRDVEVPSLHELRESAGQEALPPFLRVQTKLAAGLLPGIRGCAECGREPAATARVHVECERARVEDRLNNRAALAGCLLVGCFGWLIALPTLVMLRFRGPTRQFGNDVVVVVPVPVCDACRPVLTDPAALGRALRTVPDYADLLDRYPEARLELLPGT